MGRVRVKAALSGRSLRPKLRCSAEGCVSFPGLGRVMAETAVLCRGWRVSHAPDYFARRADGSAVVVDCRPAGRRKPADVEKFEATARACTLAGWEYELRGAADPVVTANLRWLAGYRHPRYEVPATAGVLRQVFAAGAPLMSGAGAAGGPLATLPVLFHLLWGPVLAPNPSGAPGGATPVRPAR